MDRHCQRLCSAIAVLVFVYEFVCGGGMSGRPVPQSLAVEGGAMLAAALSDFARIPGCRVVTTCDSNVDRPVPQVAGARVVSVRDATEVQQEFRALAAECDVSFVIAPEFEGILSDCRRVVEEVGGRWLGCSQQAIELCADKLRLCEHLQRHGVPTIDTLSFDPLTPFDAVSFPCVLKPRDGAGSLNTWLVHDRDEFERVVDESNSADGPLPRIMQPYVPGRSLSVAALVHHQPKHLEVFPPCEQQLSQDGRFRYLGGRIPADGVDRVVIDDLVRRCCETIEGLGGYVGFDLILPHDAPDQPVIVEINPRLTTSYLGYRKLTSANLAERMLFAKRNTAELTWRDDCVEFQPDGSVSGP